MSFPLIGNERVREALCGREDRIPHAVILEGEAGTGKRTLAQYLAKTLVCEAEDAPCGVCRSCHLAEIGTHPDIETITTEDKKKSITVGQIRDLRSMAYLAPHTAPGRVFIVEKADTMNVSAQNSLLKVLEEPPAGVTFLLLAEASNRLLETVVSRCAVFSLYPPVFEDAVQAVGQHTGAELEAVRAAVKDAENNIGKAILLLSGASDTKGAEVARSYFDALCDGRPLDALKATTAIDKDRPAAGDFVAALKELLYAKIKQSGHLKETRREYTRMADALTLAEPLLITNINLTLFFTSLTSKLMTIRSL